MTRGMRAVEVDALDRLKLERKREDLVEEELRLRSKRAGDEAEPGKLWRQAVFSALCGIRDDGSVQLEG